MVIMSLLVYSHRADIIKMLQRSERRYIVGAEETKSGICY